MAFQAECVFCGYQVQVPDRALGASGRCPHCSSFYTLVPLSLESPPGDRRVARGAWQGAKDADLGPGPDAREELRPSRKTKCFSTDHPRPATHPPPPPSRSAPTTARSLIAVTVSARSAAVPSSGAHWIEPCGLAALLTTGMALLCASVSWLCVFVVPLSILGCVLGSFGLLRVLAKGGFYLGFPIAGTAVGGLVFCAALGLPSILGPAYVVSRGKNAVDLTAIRAIPLPGSNEVVRPAESEWVDASRTALQQGGIQVQIVSASVGPLQAKISPRKKPPEYLVIRLRRHEVSTAGEFTTQRSGSGSIRLEKPRPKVTDNTGKIYQPREIWEVAPAENPRKTSVFPVAVHDEVFVLETPPAGLEYLRLEVPAEGWGGSGSFRFTIPSSMIGHRRSRPANSGGLAGQR